MGVRKFNKPVVTKAFSDNDPVTKGGDVLFSQAHWGQRTTARDTFGRPLPAGRLSGRCGAAIEGIAPHGHDGQKKVEFKENPFNGARARQGA